MLAGLLDVDWTALEHAYGSAEDVPCLLRGIASDDEDERERALEEFYACVHHQGNVYDATVASLSFLFELAANTDLADRGKVIELIASIGEPVADVAAGGGGLGPFLRANALVRGCAEEFVSWLADDDADVRGAAAFAVAAFVGDAERAIGLLEGRLNVEADAECRIALLRAAARLAIREPHVAEQVTRWLERIVGGDGDEDPATRLEALVQLAHRAPNGPGDGVVKQAIALLRAAPDAPTGRPLRDLSDALAGRVVDRVTLIEDQLRHPDPHRRIEALRLAGQLMRGWRGSYESLVTLIGGHLSAPEPQVARMALLALTDKYDLVAPAADALAERIAAAGPDAWISADPELRHGYRTMVVTLARLGDERVPRVIEAALPLEAGAFTLGHELGRYHLHSGRFVPTLRGQLDAQADELLTGFPISVFGLLAAVRQLRAVEALPEVRRVLGAAMRGRQWLVVEVALGTLASFGPAAAEAYELAVGLIANEEQEGQVALRAIEACWSLHGEADAVLPLLETRLHRAAEPSVVRTAAEVVGAIGPQAAPLAGHLRTLVSSAADEWTRVECAIALARIAGPAEYPSVQPVLQAAWRAKPHTREKIAECVRDLGAAAKPFHPALRAELADPRRHTYNPGLTDSDEVRRDERLLILCTQALNERGG